MHHIKFFSCCIRNIVQRYEAKINSEYLGRDAKILAEYWPSALKYLVGVDTAASFVKICEYREAVIEELGTDQISLTVVSSSTPAPLQQCNRPANLLARPALPRRRLDGPWRAGAGVTAENVSSSDCLELQQFCVSSRKVTVSQCW